MKKFIELRDSNNCLHYISVDEISHIVECGRFVEGNTTIIFKDKTCFTVIETIEEVRRVLEKCGYFKLVKVPLKGNKKITEEIKRLSKEIDNLYSEDEE